MAAVLCTDESLHIPYRTDAMSTFNAILLRVNVAAVLITGFEACMSFGFISYAVQVLGNAELTNYLVATFWLALFVAELPTGYLMDRWGGRKALIVSLSLRAIAFVMFFVGAGSAATVFCANFIAGVAVTFLSGAFATQVTRDCRAAAVEIDHSRLAMSALYVRSLGLIVGTAVGYFAAKAIGIKALWLISAGWALVSAVYVSIAWSATRADVCAPLLGHYRTTWRKIRATEGLTASTVLLSAYRTLLLPVTTNAVFLLVPELDRAPGSLLVFYLLAGAVGLAASRVFPYVAEHTQRGRWLASVAVGICVLMMAVVPKPLAYMAFVVFLVIAGVTETQLRSDFYERLDAGQAGAISSVQSLLENALGALAFLACAWIISVSSVVAMYIAFAVGFPVMWLSVVRRLRSFRPCSPNPGSPSREGHATLS